MHKSWEERYESLRDLLVFALDNGGAPTDSLLEVLSDGMDNKAMVEAYLSQPITLPKHETITPTFDASGYPTEEYLEQVQWWSGQDMNYLLSQVAAGWYWKDMAQNVRPDVWTFATGGWSGNEDLLSALRSNIHIYRGADIYLRGGLYCVALGEAQKAMEEEVFTHVRDWAWEGRNERTS
jgi:hypothetical protein